MPKIDLVGPGYLGRSTNVNTSRCVNFYPTLESPGSKNISSLVGTPGTLFHVNVGSGPIRGIHVFNDLMYLVSGGTLYSVDEDKNISSSLGTLQTSSGRVVMADNGLEPTGGDQLVLADGNFIYIFDVGTSAFSTISIAAHTICFLGGYFIADIGGSQFQVSGLYDGTSWNSLDKSTADSSPDDLLAVFNNHNELWLFGEYTTEVWYQSGSGNPPFARLSGGVIDFGCAARYSISQGSNSVFWLGTIRDENQGEFAGICMTSGYSAQIISTPSINYLISQYANIDDAFGYCYTEEGHEFYVITFPVGNATWAYDITTNLWHERSLYSDNPYKVNRHVSNCYIYFKRKHYIGDYRNGYLYQMSSGFYDDNGQPIVSFRTTDYIYDAEALNNIFINKIQVDAEVGVTSSIKKYTSSYSIFTTNDTSDTNIVMTINGTEVINTYLSEFDVDLSNPLPFIFMLAINNSLKNWPTSGGYWENWKPYVTFNEDETITLQLPTHNATVYRHHAPIEAIMIPSDGITNPTHLTYPQYPEIIAFAKNNDYTFSLSLENPYTNNIVSYIYVTEDDPMVMLSWSDDGGHTWSNERTVKMGKTGNYLKRLIWRRLGKSRNRIFRISISDAIKKVLIASYVDLKKGNS
jgi:hypothetical protein